MKGKVPNLVFLYLLLIGRAFWRETDRAAHRLGAGALSVFANSLSWKGVLERVSGTFILLAKVLGFVS